ncbi:hypothetical protein BJ165DRAFT_1595888 [Panaeolus papilionaceus]|nr:hypothetical protein BJ165DRAFT_1595888 [Panaeolus papilionaceus]
MFNPAHAINVTSDTNSASRVGSSVPKPRSHAENVGEMMIHFQTIRIACITLKAQMDSVFRASTCHQTPPCEDCKAADRASKCSESIDKTMRVIPAGLKLAVGDLSSVSDNHPNKKWLYSMVVAWKYHNLKLMLLKHWCLAVTPAYEALLKIKPWDCGGPAKCSEGCVLAQSTAIGIKDVHLGHLVNRIRGLAVPALTDEEKGAIEKLEQLSGFAQKIPIQPQKPAFFWTQANDAFDVVFIHIDDGVVASSLCCNGLIAGAHISHWQTRSKHLGFPCATFLGPC